MTETAPQSWHKPRKLLYQTCHPWLSSCVSDSKSVLSPQGHLGNRDQIGFPDRSTFRTRRSEHVRTDLRLAAVMPEQKTLKTGTYGCPSCSLGSNKLTTHLELYVWLYCYLNPWQNQNVLQPCLLLSSLDSTDTLTDLGSCKGQLLAHLLDASPEELA